MRNAWRKGSDKVRWPVEQLRPVMFHERIIQTCVVLVGDKLQRQGDKALKKYQTYVFNELHD